MEAYPERVREARIPSPAARLTPTNVLAIVAPLLQQSSPPSQEAPPCEWCHGPTVWTTGNKTRCTHCGYVPS